MRLKWSCQIPWSCVQMFDMGAGDEAEEVLVEGVPPESYLERFQVCSCAA